MTDVPYVLDIKDDLERAREATDADVGEEISAVGERLDAYADRTDATGGRIDADAGGASADPEGVLEEIENELLRLEELTDGTAERRLRSARNRVHVFRDAIAAAPSGVAVLEAKTRLADAGAEVETEEVSGEATEFWLTLANDTGERQRVTVTLDLYADGDRVTSYVSETTVGADEQKTVTVIAEVPEEAAYFGVRLASDPPETEV